MNDNMPKREPPHVVDDLATKASDDMHEAMWRTMSLLNDSRDRLAFMLRVSSDVLVWAAASYAEARHGRDAARDYTTEQKKAAISVIGTALVNTLAAKQ